LSVTQISWGGGVEGDGDRAGRCISADVQGLRLEFGGLRDLSSTAIEEVEGVGRQGHRGGLNPSRNRVTILKIWFLETRSLVS
jgi:hypothetical protein